MGTAWEPSYTLINFFLRYLQCFSPVSFYFLFSFIRSGCTVVNIQGIESMYERTPKERYRLLSFSHQKTSLQRKDCQIPLDMKWGFKVGAILVTKKRRLTQPLECNPGGSVRSIGKPVTCVLRNIQVAAVSIHTPHRFILSVPSEASNELESTTRPINIISRAAQSELVSRRDVSDTRKYGRRRFVTTGLKMVYTQSHDHTTVWFGTKPQTTG
jgi:hypothetical protein